MGLPESWTVGWIVSATSKDGKMSVKADLIEGLKRFGAEHDYSESDLARKLKVSKGLVDAWFSGEGTPSLDAALRIRRLKHGSSNAGSGVSGIPFRRGNIGALPSKQSNLLAIRDLKARARTMLVRNAASVASPYLRLRDLPADDSQEL